MTRALVTLLLTAALVGHARGDEPRWSIKQYDAVAPIVKELLKGRPLVIGFGEYHETNDGPKVRSAIARFTDEIFTLLSKRSSDIVVETWIPEGKCGQKEVEVTQKVEETIQRPETTEDEVVRLINHANDAGVEPHVLVLSCPEYQSLQPDKEGKIDSIKLLDIVTTHLRKLINGIVAGKAIAKKTDRDKYVLVYGGALHNDVFPLPDFERFSFAADVQRFSRNRYLEVDLYVPELIEDDQSVTAEPWFAQWKATGGTKLTLVKRSPRSYIIVFPRSPKA